ncbi:MAG: alpha/beta hydrolase family protein [Proteobacteria bacterium]|nr:alpha/beta hydrolase family protein [Pseudomonadota bacterium]
MRILRSPVARLIARPWLDFLALGAGRRYFFPVSRLWAMAREAEGSVDHFMEALPDAKLKPRKLRKLSAALDLFEHCRLKASMTEQLWDEYLFGSAEVSLEHLLMAEEMRLDVRTAYNMTRKRFAPFRGLLHTSVKMVATTPEQVVQRFGEQGEHLATLFRLPDSFPAVEVSRRIPVPRGEDYWIRFPSPSAAMADMVYARVHEPPGVTNPPTLIFGHGMCVEFDHYHNLVDEVAGLVEQGIRVVRPEAPWHGRRVLPGHYGGEQLLSTAPTGMFDYLSAQHKEWAVIIDWCRKTSSGPVAVGGVSLGAQTAKSVAMAANDWPKALRPDAVFAVIHCSHIAEAVLDGALSDVWNFSGALRDAGWSRDLARKWLLRLDPMRQACVPPERVVSVTGTHDVVTRQSWAYRQMDYWQVPDENRFSYRRGHFSVPLGMIRDTQPLIRLREILSQC